MNSLISARSSVKTNRKPRPKPERRVNLLLAPTRLMPGIVRIQVGTEPWSDYNLAGIPSDYGRAFRLVKILGPHDRYDVLLHGEHSTCECRGFLRWHHCKHVSALQALVNAGKL
jgi:hypothetical protein